MVGRARPSSSSIWRQPKRQCATASPFTLPWWVKLFRLYRFHNRYDLTV